MTASIRSKSAATIVGLLMSAGVLGGAPTASASSEPSEQPTAVEVQTDGTVIHYVPTANDVWLTSSVAPQDPPALEMQSDGTSYHFFPAPSGSGSVL